jgi:hypothetical protein
MMPKLNNEKLKKGQHYVFDMMLYTLGLSEKTVNSKVVHILVLFPFYFYFLLLYNFNDSEW